MLKAYISAIVRDPVRAEDIFSEVTIQIIRSWENYDQARPFTHWSRGVARRVALASLRTENRQALLLEEGVLDNIAREVDELGDETALERRKEALRECMERLPEHERDLIRQRYFEERTYQDIARLASKRVGALYVRFSRLHHALRRCVEHKLRLA